ncbi:MAG: PQQ-binding-like beta-propeller repeat protein, partial [Kiritimatiellae bacterium]|nr:PQQ-binding-like beta-propeller repeat protein [Kiritimatiellia bacterium]
MKSSTVFLLLVILWIDIPTIATADWPQFMRDAAHTGDAADEVVRLPLRLYLRVGLDDAILTTPAVIGSRAWVVDQMGTAYGIDVERGILLWKTSPEQGRAMGFNTCSPCVANGRVYYATTAGNFHILDAETGRLIKTVPLGAPVISSTTWANDSIYLQTVDAVVWCFDPEGNVRWTWNHYMRYREPPERTKAEANKRGHPGSYERPHYGGQEVCVAGRRVITSMGWDLLCLEDRKDDAEVVWCNRAPAGRDGMIPMSSSVSSGFVYTAGMGADGVLGLMRTSL